MNQTNNPPENNVPEIISTIVPQKKKLKKVAALFISIYVPLILSCVAAFIYSSVSIVPNGGLGNLGVVVVGEFIVAAGVVISVILSIIFSLRFIKNNFKKVLRINWQFTLKFLVCLTIFILIAGTLSRLVSILFTGIISQYAVLVILPIAIIGFALTTTRMILSEDVGKKTALITCAFAALFLFFFYGLTYLVQQVSISGSSISLNSIVSNDMLGNYVYVLIYITIIYFVFVLPILLIVIGKVNARYENEATGSATKNIGGMKLRFILIIFGIAMTAFLILGFLPSDGSMVNSKTASDGTQTIVNCSSNNIYIKGTYFSSDGKFLYYILGSSNKSEASFPTLNKKLSIFRLNLSTQAKQCLAADVDYYQAVLGEGIGFKPTSDNSLYYIKFSDGKKSLISADYNANVISAYGNTVFYYSYNTKSLVARDLATDKETTVNSEVQWQYIKYVDSDNIVISDSNSVYSNDVLMLVDRKDNSVQQLAGTEDAVADPYISGGKIYWTREASSKTSSAGKIFVYDIANKKIDNSILISGISGLEIVEVVDKKIYFVGNEYCYIYSINSDLSGSSEILIDNASLDPTNSQKLNFEDFNSEFSYKKHPTKLIDDKVYFTNYTDGGRLYEIDINTKSTKKVSDIETSIIIGAADGYVYFEKMDYKNKLDEIYRADSSGNSTLLFFPKSN